ncbi:MAG TPA: hypothetical protein VJ623_07905 [Holophagaceae bacterium]|nr:hypothetical protein [Holophagaceae bacterium]
MIQPLGNPQSPGITPQAPSPGVLQAQLAKTEGQLQDCVTCDSARTPQGQAKIQTLSLKVQSLKARLEEVRKVGDTVAAPPPVVAPPRGPSPLEGGRLDLLA